MTPNGNDLAGGLAAFRALPASERKPAKLVEVVDNPLTALPEGGLRFRVYTHALNRDAKGVYSRPGTWMGNTGEIAAETQTDFLWLLKAEREALVPVRPKKGDTLRVPAAVYNRICWHHLGDYTLGFSDGGFAVSPKYPPPPPGRMTLTVEGVSDKEVRMRLHGSARLTHGGGECDVLFEGVVIYDTGKGAFRRFDFVAIGEVKGVPDPGDDPTGGYPFWHITPPGHTRHLAVAFELVTGDAPNDLLPPHAMKAWDQKYFQTGG